MSLHITECGGCGDCGRCRKEKGEEGYDDSWRTLGPRLISTHGLLWAKQSVRAKNEMLIRSEQHIARKNEEVRLQIDEVMQQKHMLEGRLSATSDDPGPITMSGSSLGKLDLDNFLRLYDDPDYASIKRVAAVRTNVTTAPAPCTELKATGEDPWSWSEGAMPAWAKALAPYREFFEYAALVTTNPDGSHRFFKVVYITQSPVYVAVTEMIPVEHFHTTHPLDTSSKQIQKDFVTYAFKCNFGKMMSAEGMPDVNLDQLHFLPNLRHEGGTRITSNECISPVLRYMWGKADVKEKKPAEKKARKEKDVDPEYEELLKLYPWLQHLDFSEGFTRDQRAVTESQAASSSGGLEPLPVIDEDELMAGLAKVEKAREAEVAVGSDMGLVDFFVSIRGGRRHLGKKGVYDDAVQAKSSKRGHQWAKDRGLQVTFKATFSKHGEDGSRVLARSWCHRMQHFFNLQQEHGGPGFKFTKKMIEDYLEPAELTRMSETMENPLWAERIFSLQGIPIR